MSDRANQNIDRAPERNDVSKAKRERYRSSDFGSRYDSRYRGGINRLNTEVERKWIASQMASGAVLDAGAGTGRFSSHLAELGHNVIALDSSAGMLAELKHKSPQVETLLGDIYNLPFAKPEFDTVVCMHVLFHLPDWDKVIGVLAGVLKPGGTIFFEMRSTEHVAAFGGIARKLGLLKREREMTDPSSATVHATTGRVTEVLASCGVALEHTLRYDIPHSYWFRPLSAPAELLLRKSSVARGLFSRLELSLGQLLPATAAYRTLYMGRKR
ncbi:MAG: class I SAM-dependent methyltransferase [Candidatus Glassbacteria bacterium]|nr:class I SAM-dependent methyltransferase [Candidatus Glassbacteria bacterium]